MSHFSDYWITPAGRWMLMSALVVAAPLNAQGKDTVASEHRPPPGMCRIWLKDVPPSRQPEPTDCSTAIRRRPPNARVIFGDELRGSLRPGEAGRGDSLRALPRRVDPDHPDPRRRIEPPDTRRKILPPESRGKVDPPGAGRKVEPPERGRKVEPPTRGRKVDPPPPDRRRRVEPPDPPRRGVERKPPPGGGGGQHSGPPPRRLPTRGPPPLR
jgi:hypothetical protein